MSEIKAARTSLFSRLVRFLVSNDLQLFRILAVFSAASFPIFRLVLPDGFRVDPWWIRIALSVICLVYFALTYASAWVRKHYRETGFGLIMLFCLWITGLLFFSRIDVGLSISYFIVLSSCSVLIKRYYELYTFMSVNILAALILLLSIPNPQLNPGFFIAGFVFVMTVSFVGQSLRIYLEQNLVENESWMRELFDSSPDGLLLVNPDTRCVESCNESAVQLLDADSSDALINRDIRTLIPDIFENERMSLLRDFLAMDADYYHEIQIASRRRGTVWGSVVVRTVSLTSRRSWLVRVADITAGKEVENSLRQNANILKQLNNFVLVADAQGDIIYVSPSVVQLMGYPESELLGNGWWKHSRRDPEAAKAAREFVKATASGQKPVSNEPYEQCVYSRDGQEHWIAWKDSQGENHTLIGVGYDNTLYRRDNQIKQAQVNIGAAAASNLSPDALFQALYEQIHPLFRTPNLYFGITDPVTGNLGFPFCYDVEENPGYNPYSENVRQASGLSEYAIQQKAPLLLSHSQIPALAQRMDFRILGKLPACWISAPLVNETGTFGIVVLQHYSDPKHFQQQDLDLLCLFAAQIAQIFQRIVTQQALLESEQKYRTITEAAMEGIVLHQNGVIREANSAFARIFQAEAGSLAGKNLVSFFQPAEQERLRNSLETASSESLAFHAVTATGEPLIIEVLSSRIRLREETLGITALRDISARKRAEEAEQRALADARFRAFVQNSHEIISICDESGDIAYISPSAERVLGISPGHMMHKSLFRLVHEDDRPEVLRIFGRALSASGVSALAQYRMAHENGSWRYVESAFTNLSADPHVQGVLVSTRDVTERLLAERDLHESEQRFRILFQDSPDAIFVEDRNGYVLDVNDAACRLQGMIREELIGMHVTELVPPYLRGQVEHDYARWFSGEHNVVESFTLHSSGVIIPVEIRSSIVHIRETPAIILLVRDITQRQAEQARMIQSQQQLRKQNERLLELASSSALNSGDTGLAFAEITRTAAETLLLRSVSIYIFSEDGQTLDCQCRYLQQEDRYQNAGSLPLTGLGAWMDMLLHERLLTGNAGDSAAWVQALKQPYFDPQGLESVLHAPIRLGGKLMGVLCLENDSTLNWSTEVLGFAASMADMVSLALEAHHKQQAEDRLRENAAILKSIFDATRDGVLVVDNAGNLIECNERLLKTWNITREDFLDTENDLAVQKTLVNVKDPERLLKVFEGAENGSFADIHEVFDLVDGRTVELYVRPLMADGVIRGRMWFVHDLTVLRQMESGLRDTEARYQQIFSQANDAIMLVDSGTILDFNEKSCELFGIGPAQLASRSLSSFMPENQPDGTDSATQLRTFTEQARQGTPQFFVGKFCRVDGSLFDAEVNLSRIRIGEKYLLQVILRDITARLLSEKALRESQQRNKAILDAIPDTMVQLSREGRVLDYKGSFTDNSLLLPDAASHLGDPLSAFFSGEFAQRTLEEIQAALANPETRSFEFSLRGEHGHDLYYEIRLVRSGEGEVLCIIRDVTVRKKAELELIQRNFELDSFVYRASHDLKAPLNSLMGLITLLQMETQEPSILNYIGMMNKSVVKLDTFIRDLTDFSRNARMDVEQKAVNFRELVEETLENLRFMEHADKVQIEVNLEADVPFYSDTMRLGILFNNLISNTIKYQDHQKASRYARVRIQVTEAEARICVEDNGIGIPAEHLPRIFQLFYRASIQSYGTGLGLYIVKNAVEKLQGEIHLESAPGTGTTFVVRIPNQGAPA